MNILAAILLIALAHAAIAADQPWVSFAAKPRPGAGQCIVFITGDDRRPHAPTPVRVLIVQRCGGQTGSCDEMGLSSRCRVGNRET
jgi:hypothetical protein